MLCGRSQLNEKPQGDFSILQQISVLRRENRLLKVGLIFCLVLSAMPYLTGFQPTVIRASKVVTERIEFVSDGKKVASLVVHPRRTGLVIEDGNAKEVVFLGKFMFGGIVGVYNRDGHLVASMISAPWGGSLNANDNHNESVVTIGATPYGGAIYVRDKDGKTIASMTATPLGGEIELKTPSGQTLWSAP
jgi:hypothetical protein